MIRYIETVFPGATQITTGFFRVQGVNVPVLARELLKISASEYVTREVSMRVALYMHAHPEMRNDLENADFLYMLGDPLDDGPDFETFRVPFTLYWVPRNA